MSTIIDYEYFRNLNIEDVADALGISVDNQKKFLCPCHNDHHASAILNGQDNKKEKYQNSWHCWVCGEGGSPIDLVLAVKSGILPSEAKTPGRYTVQKKEAIDFLHEVFGGGIETTDDKKNSIYPKKPNIPASILRACGLKQNPFHAKEYENNQSEAANVLLTALSKREDEIWSYTKSVITNFPRLGPKSSAYIFEQGKTWVDDIHRYIDAVQEYYEAVIDIEFPEERMDFNEIEELSK